MRHLATCGVALAAILILGGPAHGQAAKPPQQDAASATEAPDTAKPTPPDTAAEKPDTGAAEKPGPAGGGGQEAPAAATAGGAPPAEPQPPSAKKEFQDLYKQYSKRFYEAMLLQAEGMQPAQIMLEASRIWNEVFAAHKDLLRQRCEEILAELETVPPIRGELYTEAAAAANPESVSEQPQGMVFKQLLWNPVITAQTTLTTWLSHSFTPDAYAKRPVLAANAAPVWQVIDGNVDHPRLVLEQGPMLYVVDMTRHDDYYLVTKVRWLRPKSLDPTPRPSGTPGRKPAPSKGGKLFR
jgi:hypothetical protein